MTVTEQTPTGFRRVNLFQLPLMGAVSHDGHGSIMSARLASAGEVAAACHAIYYVEVPPGVSVGEHPHGSDSEEYYLVLSGSGKMRLGGETIDVSTGDLIRNDPGQVHGLTNNGTETLRLYVFDAETRPR